MDRRNQIIGEVDRDDDVGVSGAEVDLDEVLGEQSPELRQLVTDFVGVVNAITLAEVDEETHFVVFVVFVLVVVVC